MVALAEIYLQILEVPFLLTTSLPAFSTDLRSMLPRRTFSGKLKDINKHVFYSTEMITALS